MRNSNLQLGSFTTVILNNTTSYPKWEEDYRSIK